MGLPETGNHPNIFLQLNGYIILWCLLHAVLISKEQNSNAQEWGKKWKNQYNWPKRTQRPRRLPLFPLWVHPCIFPHVLFFSNKLFTFLFKNTGQFDVYNFHEYQRHCAMWKRENKRLYIGYFHFCDILEEIIGEGEQASSFPGLVLWWGCHYKMVMQDVLRWWNQSVSRF